MGNFRVFKKSVRFTFRTKKRFYVFTLIFAIIASIIAFYIDELDSLQTDRFLEQKGVVLLQDDDYGVTYDQGRNLLDDILDLESDADIKIDDHVIYDYIDLDDFLRIYSININKPWFSNFAKPSLITNGRFPEKSSEVLVPDGSYQIRNSSVDNIRVCSKIVIGQKIIYEKSNGDSLSLKVVGTFDTDNLQVKPDKADRLWLFMNTNKFEQLISFFGNDTSDAYTYSMSFTVPGNVLLFDQKATHKLVSNLNEGIKPLINDIANLPTYGSWEPTPEVLPSRRAAEEGTRNMVNLGFVAVGGIILSTMFAYLISRFRRREIAILKAMGYAHSSVRISLIAEIVTLAFAGFAFGITLAQGLLYYLSDFNQHSLLRWQAVGISFLINVAISLPGMLFVSRRVLSVSPSEAFRDK